MQAHRQQRREAMRLENYSQFSKSRLEVQNVSTFIYQSARHLALSSRASSPVAQNVEVISSYS